MLRSVQTARNFCSHAVYACAVEMRAARAVDEAWNPMARP
jgi:hypothetical protein